MFHFSEDGLSRTLFADLVIVVSREAALDG